MLQQKHVEQVLWRQSAGLNFCVGTNRTMCQLKLGVIVFIGVAVCQHGELQL